MRSELGVFGGAGRGRAFAKLRLLANFGKFWPIEADRNAAFAVMAALSLLTSE